MNNFNSMQTNPATFRNYFNPTPSTSTNNIVWVQGIEGAKAWQLSPNSMVILLDSEVEGKMYIKVSDNIGMSSLRIFNYTEEIASNATTNNDLDLSQFVRKDELVNLIKEVLANESVVPTTSTSDNNSKVVTIVKK